VISRNAPALVSAARCSQTAWVRPLAPQLDASNSKQYRTVPGLPKHAVLCWQPATYTLSWGTQQFDGPHMVVDADDHRYGVDLRAFFTTHKPVADQPDHYVKDAVVRALQVSEDTDLITEVDGRHEMRSTVKAGGWIVQNPGGEQYYNTPEDFQHRYQPLDER
jgi:hypothetical protein